MAATEFTGVNRGWLVKMLIFLVVMVGFGFYGLWDATVAYPGRGYEDASYKKKLYLEKCEEASAGGRTEFLNSAAVAAPDAKYATLVAHRDELEQADNRGEALQAKKNQGGAEGTQAAREYQDLLPKLVDAACLKWLESLALVGGLRPSKLTIEQAPWRADFDDPKKEVTALKERWSKASPPSALKAYDLPLQWFFTFAGFAGAAWILLTLFRTSRKRFGWDPQEKRLYLPGDKSLVPGDIAEFDKRKWDKFFIFLHLKPEAGGGEIKLDLLRHANLEGWVLEMERIAFPENVKAAEEQVVKAEKAEVDSPPGV